MNFEGEKGTENVEKLAKLETLGNRIKEIGLNPETKTYPAVGYFLSGYDPLKNSDDLDSESKSNSSVRSVDSRNPKNPRMQVVVGSSGYLVDFVGRNYSGESTTPQHGALGVKEKENGVNNKKKVPITSNREKKREALLLRLMIGMEPRMDRSRPINLKATEAKTSTATVPRKPPHDVEATSPDMAYPLEKIIFEEDWKYLVDIFELVEAGSYVSPVVYPTFVCNRAHKIRAIKDEEKRKRMAGILSYITHLIKYKDSHSMGGVSSKRQHKLSSTSHHKLPSILAQKFSSLFSETEDERLTYKTQLLLVNYVLVLSLFADDFRSDLSDIAKDLRMSPFEIRAHFNFLGCKFSNENVDVATLSAPLEFEQTKRTWKRR